MLRLSRLSILVLVVIVLAAFLPELYRKGFERRRDRLFILYSAPLGRFMFRVTDRFNRVAYYDEDGRTYDRMEYEKRLPFFYYRDLLKWDALPETVCGVPLDVETIRRESQFLRITPDELHAPQIGLWPLFESASPFARLEYPDAMFRITHRMEFVDAARNEVMEDRSAAFTAALEEQGFRFPPRLVAGNPTDRKPFDEGYFVADAAGRLFHVKMVKGEPRVKDTGIQPASGIRLIKVREHPRREFYGAMVTGDGKVHLLTYDDYALRTLPLDGIDVDPEPGGRPDLLLDRFRPLPLDGFDPDRMTLQMIADPLNRTIIYYDPDEDVIHGLVTDRNYRVVRTAGFPVHRDRNAAAETAAKILFPFRIETASAKSDYVLFRVKTGDPLALAGILHSLAALAVIRYRRRGRGCGPGLVDWIVTALAGPFGLAAVLVVGPEPRRG